MMDIRRGRPSAPKYGEPFAMSPAGGGSRVTAPSSVRLGRRQREVPRKSKTHNAARS